MGNGTRRTGEVGVKEYIITVDESKPDIMGSVPLIEPPKELIRCKECIHWDKGHTEECDNLDSVCFHNGWCKPDWFCPNGKRR